MNKVGRDDLFRFTLQRLSRSFPRLFCDLVGMGVLRPGCSLTVPSLPGGSLEIRAVDSGGVARGRARGWVVLFSISLELQYLFRFG